MASYVSEVLADDPRGFWRLDEVNRANGAEVVDWSGRGGTATYFGTVSGTTNANGDANGAALLNGTDAYIETPIRFNYSNFTLEFWMKSTSAPIAAEQSGPFQKGAPYGFNWNHFEPDFRAAFTMNINGEYIVLPLTGVQAGQWYHVAATWDGQVLRVYRDGIRIHEELAFGTLNGETRPIRFGRNARDGIIGFWEGAIHDVAVYGKALPQSRLQAHISAMLSPTPVSGSAYLVGFSHDSAKLVADVPSGGKAPYTYQWERRLEETGAWSPVSGQTTLQCTDSGLDAETQYYYRLAVTDANANVGYSNLVPVLTSVGVYYYADFDDNQIPPELTPWKNRPDSGASVAVENQCVRVTIADNQSGDHYAGLWYQGPVDLRDGLAKIHAKTSPVGPDAEIEIVIGVGMGDWDTRYAFHVNYYGNLGSKRVIHAFADRGAVFYGPDTQVPDSVYLRIRHSSLENLIFFEYSVDDVTWVTFDSLEPPADFPLSRCEAVLLAGSWDQVTSSVAEIDDFVLQGKEPGEPPAAVTGLKLEGKTLSWNPSFGALRYRIERRRVL